ncbi:DUF3489 domain-containing protein [Bacteroides ovatus]|nr:DUF3489 domain-containing protein [Bacteroides ovatus]
MTNNKNNSSPELNDPQGIDRSLLEYLKPKSEDRYSKLEAYCDLLTRATSGTYSTSVVVGNLKLLPYQFIATISELARKWQWQRATVRQFLTGLANLVPSNHGAILKKLCVFRKPGTTPFSLC